MHHKTTSTPISERRNHLIQFLEQLENLDFNLLQQYSLLWEQKDFSKGEFITEKGQVERYLYFVVAGVQKSFAVKNDKDFVMAFTYAPSFSGVPESFLNQKKSEYFLQCITDTQTIRIAYTQQEQMLQKFGSLNKLFRTGLAILLEGMIERHFELMAMSMEERFRIFTNRSAPLLHLVPHKDIASYLCIDPTNFSKLMGKIKIGSGKGTKFP